MGLVVVVNALPDTLPSGNLFIFIQDVVRPYYQLLQDLMHVKFSYLVVIKTGPCRHPVTTCLSPTFLTAGLHFYQLL